MHETQQSYFLLQRIISNKALLLKSRTKEPELFQLILLQIQFPYLSYQASTLLRLWGSQLGAIGWQRMKVCGGRKVRARTRLRQ